MSRGLVRQKHGGQAKARKHDAERTRRVRRLHHTIEVRKKRLMGDGGVLTAVNDKYRKEMVSQCSDKAIVFLSVHMPCEAPYVIVCMQDRNNMWAENSLGWQNMMGPEGKQQFQRLVYNVS